MIVHCSLCKIGFQRHNFPYSLNPPFKDFLRHSWATRASSCPRPLVQYQLTMTMTIAMTKTNTKTKTKTNKQPFKDFKIKLCKLLSKAACTVSAENGNDNGNDKDND